MRICKIRLKNLSSFIQFENDIEFKRQNLIFGTNGSGKSTLVRLLQLIDNYKRKQDSNSENALKVYLRDRMSKEANSKGISIDIVFDTGSVSIYYDSETDTIKSPDTIWTPVRVFNDEYTSRNIGNTIRLDLQESGILIGEVNIEIDEAIRIRNSLSRQLDLHLEEAGDVIEKVKSNYKESTSSSANVDSIISLENLLHEDCQYHQDSTLLNRRKQLGFGKPDRSLVRLDVQQVKLRFSSETVENKCTEIVSAPVVEKITESFLKSFTDFFTAGLDIYDSIGEQVCPFCRRDWVNAEEVIQQYRNYLKSTYSKKREGIRAIQANLTQYRNQIVSQASFVDRTHQVVQKEANKYQIDITGWKQLEYDQLDHDAIYKLLTVKVENMDRAISVSEKLLALEQAHVKTIEHNNSIINSIQKEIDAVSVRRREMNAKLAEHFAAKMWTENNKLRKTINQLQSKIQQKAYEIAQLEEATPPQDIIRTVFNGLLSFIGLSEYFIDANKRLNIRIEQKDDISKEYDISDEGVRISSAQRKILSLCYFFADIVSELQNTKELKKHIIVFDDPVDSADYVFFYSITTAIEKIETLLRRILSIENLKFGQFFVFTHNSLMYDRLACSWKDFSRSLKKENGSTIMLKAEKTINNYSEYIKDICKYYKKPDSQKRRMIYIGNLIRRVLEILCSFDKLCTIEFQSVLDGMGKSKLALIANHLSHESFSKILNPLSSPAELQEACKQLLELIRDKHPSQYETICTMYEMDIPVVSPKLVGTRSIT